MWQIGKTYAFMPSGDADELHIKILGVCPSRAEAIEWYETTYDRPYVGDDRVSYKAVVVRGGIDGDIRHRRGDVYYVFDTDLKPSHSQPEGPQIVERPPTLRERGFHEEH